MTRLEAQVTFDALCRRWRRIELDESGAVWNDYFAIRSVDRLPLRVSPN
jgi:hypothetical protein